MATNLTKQPSTRAIILHDFFVAMAEFETRREDVASWIERDETLDRCADALQAMREHYWMEWRKVAHEYE